MESNSISCAEQASLLNVDSMMSDETRTDSLQVDLIDSSSPLMSRPNLRRRRNSKYAFSRESRPRFDDSQVEGQEILKSDDLHSSARKVDSDSESSPSPVRSFEIYQSPVDTTPLHKQSITPISRPSTPFEAALQEWDEETLGDLSLYVPCEEALDTQLQQLQEMCWDANCDSVSMILEDIFSQIRLVLQNGTSTVGETTSVSDLLQLKQGLVNELEEVEFLLHDYIVSQYHDATFSRAMFLIRDTKELLLNCI